MNQSASLPALTIGAFTGAADYFDAFDSVSSTSSPLSAVFTGDIMLARHVEQVVERYGPEYVFSGLSDFATSSAWVGNFEGAVGPVHTPTPDGGMNFSVATTSVQALLARPFSHMSLANNHSYDQGKAGFDLTQSTLRELGIVPFGDQRVSSSTVAYVKINGGIVALLGVYALGVSQNLDVLHTQLQIAQERSDVQVVYVHWGEEYQATHSTAQRQLAEALSALGVHAIIGHHPHVVQDIEIIGDTLVFYSLGNFVFDQYFSDEVEDGLIVELALVDNTLEYQLYGVSSQGSRSRPQLLPQYDADRFLERLAKKSDASLQAEIRRGVITQYIQ